MDPLIALSAALAGYLLGSISFARVVVGVFTPGKKIQRIKVMAPGSEGVIESNSVSATTVRMQLGSRYGCLVSILDMVKAALPALVLRLLYPQEYYYLIAASLAVVGHNYPLYYRFKGGRGLSPVLGGFLVVDWLGTLLTNLAGFLIGLPIKNTLIVSGLGIVLMIPWIWFRSRNWQELLYVVLMNLLFWYAMIPELKEYARLQREGHLEAFKEARRLEVIGEDGSVRYDTGTLSSMMDHIKQFFTRSEPRDGGES